MSKMIQVRNVPDKLHRELTRRAKARGQTLTAYIQRLLEREVATPPIEDVLDRIESRPRIRLEAGEAAEWISKGREEHDADIERRLRAASKRRVS